MLFENVTLLLPRNMSCAQRGQGHRRCNIGKHGKIKNKHMGGNHGDPNCTKVGAAMVAAIKYARMERKPIVNIMQVSMVSNKVVSKLVLPNWIIAFAMLRSRPLKLTTSIIIPTTAQATATAAFVLSSKASRISRVFMRVFFRAATPIVTTMVKKVEKITIVELKRSMYNKKTMGSNKWPRASISAIIKAVALIMGGSSWPPTENAASTALANSLL